MESRDALLRRATEPWPDLDIPRHALAGAMDALARDGLQPTPADAAVVGLAVACGAGDEAALRAFEGLYFPAARRAAEGVLDDHDAVHEVIQRLRQRLFLASESDPPAVVRAAGRGDMGKFVRVAALRLALNLQRDDRRRHEVVGEDELLPVLDDPELRLQKAISIEALKDAFEAAIADLTPKQRNLLRHHLVDHLGIDELATRYGVHRATAARWLAAAREAVAERTRACLRERIGDDVPIDHLRDLVQSRLDLSLTRLLSGHG